MFFLSLYVTRHRRWNLYLKAYLSFETDIVLHCLWMWNVHFSTSDHGSDGGVSVFQDMCAFVSVQKKERQTMRRDGIGDQICLQLFCLLQLSGSADNCLCLCICVLCTICINTHLRLNFCTKMCKERHVEGEVVQITSGLGQRCIWSWVKMQCISSPFIKAT